MITDALRALREEGEQQLNIAQIVYRENLGFNASGEFLVFGWCETYALSALGEDSNLPGGEEEVEAEVQAGTMNGREAVVYE